MAHFSKKKAGNFLIDLDNANFLAVFDKYNDGVLITNSDGVIVYYNKAMSRIDEQDPENALLKRIVDVYDLDNESSMLMQCLITQKPIIDQPIYYRTRMGKFANTIHNVFPIFNKNKMVGAIGFVRDYNVLAETLASMKMPEKNQRMKTHSITFDSIIGEDPVFRNALNSAGMAAHTPSPVMLYGETGTGKELFARAIHNHSPRSDKKYTPVNCAAIPENLLEGILFGTSKGAFTGAINKAGLFERTSKGTIFLDEINSMPVGLQSKILRIIQERKVRRVGDLKEIKFDLKIISSVNQDPHQAIVDKSLRSDLFYRLGVVFIHIVPLRSRLGDLPLLVDHFIQKHNKMLYKNVNGIEDNVMEAFWSYNWPGNVRELEHVLEGAMNIIGTSYKIGMKHLQPHFSNKSVKHKPFGSGNGNRISFPRTGENTRGIEGGLISYKKEQEQELIHQTLAEYRGNVSKSARNLGISRQLLYYKMKKYNFSRKDFQ